MASCPGAYVEVDAAGLVIEWNPPAEELLGWRRDEVVGRSIIDSVLTPAMLPSPLDVDVLRTLLPCPPHTEASPVEHRRLVLAHRSGHTVNVEGTWFALDHGDGRSTGSVGGFLEVAETAAGSPASISSGWDPLTGLPDRKAFERKLTDATTRARGTPASVAVVLLDLDRFKAVNSSMGHPVGDLVLAEVARRLQRVAPGQFFARFGGDEFLVLFESGTGRAHDEALAFAHGADEALADPFDVSGFEVFLSASVGVALNTFGVDEAASLLSNAESAMYRAKRRGGSRVETFGESMRIEMLDRMGTEHALHRALERGELTVHYQPVVEIDGVTTVSVEALLRWRHPKGGLVPPTRFIPVAEESGLIVPIGAWVIAEACNQLRSWNHRQTTGPRGSVEVNLSARQIDDPRILPTVEQILSTTGLPPELLTLEITESALMEDAASALHVLRALKDIGVLLAVDDFGTGYSALSYLQRFPLDLLKVDRSFVVGLGSETGGSEIVSAIVDLGHALGLKVVAEGVETTAQLEVLRSLGCDLAQGFLFSRPLPASEIVTDFGLLRIA